MNTQFTPFSVVLLAGGIGSRMKASIPKQYLLLRNKLIALHSFELFVSMPEVDQIVVVCESHYQHLFLEHSINKKIIFAVPGLRRQDSVWNGVACLEDNPLVCIHDSARPFILEDHIRATVQAAAQYGAAALGVPVKSTIKNCDSNQMVRSTLERSTLWEIQTPQVIRLDLLKEGFSEAQNKQLTVSDDVSLIELIEHPVKIIKGHYSNIKVTTTEDLIVLEQLLEKHARI